MERVATLADSDLEVGRPHGRSKAADSLASSTSSTGTAARSSIRRLSLLNVEIDLAEANQLAAMRSAGVDGASEGTNEEEPPINSEEDIAKWLTWAKKEAALYADLMHPRRSMFTKRTPSSEHCS